MKRLPAADLPEADLLVVARLPAKCRQVEALPVGRRQAKDAGLKP
jgi:hypothetical protein